MQCYAMHTLSRPTDRRGDRPTNQQVASSSFFDGDCLTSTGQWRKMMPFWRGRLKDRFNEAAERNRVCGAEGGRNGTERAR